MYIFLYRLLCTRFTQHIEQIGDFYPNLGINLGGIRKDLIALFYRYTDKTIIKGTYKCFSYKNL